MEPYSWFGHFFNGALVAFAVITLPGFILESSRYHSYHPLSVREKELANLRNHVWGGQDYIVVTGAIGVGKSCLINSFISERGGVVECIIPPGTDQKTIVNKALHEITKFPIPDYVLLEYRAWWAIYVYKKVYQKSPILVIRASERLTTQLKPPAELTGAVRTLTEKYGFHVIVDCPPNAVDPGLLETNRETVVNIEPYDQETLWKIPEFQVLFEDLGTIGLKTKVWAVLGGFPVLYEEIDRQSSAFAERDREGNLTDNGKKALQDIVWKILEAQIDKAINAVRSARDNYSELMEEILRLVKSNNLTVSAETLTSNKLKRPDPDKVFQNGKRFLVPATPAIGLVIRHNLTKVPPREELIELLK